MPEPSRSASDSLLMSDCSECQNGTAHNHSLVNAASGICKDLSDADSQDPMEVLRDPHSFQGMMFKVSPVTDSAEDKQMLESLRQLCLRKVKDIKDKRTAIEEICKTVSHSVIARQPNVLGTSAGQATGSLLRRTRSAPADAEHATVSSLQDGEIASQAPVDEISHDIRTLSVDVEGDDSEASSSSAEEQNERQLFSPNRQRRKAGDAEIESDAAPAIGAPSEGEDGHALPFALPFDLDRFNRDFIEVKSFGKGGFGSVHLVQHKVDGHTYCVKKVKFYSKSFARLFKTMIKTLREVRTLARLNHPNIVRYYNCWLEPTFENDGRSPNSAAEEGSVGIETIDSMTETGEFTTTSGISTSNEDSLPAHMAAMNRNPFQVGWAASGDIEMQVNGVVAAALTSGDDSWSGSGFSDDQSSTSGNEEELGGSAPFSGSSDRSLSMDNSSSPGTSTIEAIDAAGNQGGAMALVPQSQGGKGQAADEDQTLGIVLYIQMEACEEATLQEIIHSRGSTVLPLESTNALRQVANALYHVHALGLCHRDVKPSNVFVQKPMILKLGDFGLAREAMMGDDFWNSPNGAEIDGFTAGAGTAAYASPEQISGEACSAATDIYSFGVIALEAFHPFGTKMERARALEELRTCSEVPALLKQTFPEVARFVRHCCAPDPLDRPDAENVLRVLDQWERAMMPSPSVGSSVPGSSIPSQFVMSGMEGAAATISAQQTLINQLQSQLKILVEHQEGASKTQIKALTDKPFTDSEEENDTNNPSRRWIDPTENPELARGGSSTTTSSSISSASSANENVSLRLQLATAEQKNADLQARVKQLEAENLSLMQRVRQSQQQGGHAALLE